jgi:hypothetical protein
MTVTDCAVCGARLCPYCGRCHVPSCRVAVSVCQFTYAARSLASRGEQRAYLLLAQKVVRLRELQAIVPHTMTEAYEQQIEANITVGTMLDTVARLLRPELGALVRELVELDWALWHVDRLPKGALPPMVSKGRL